MLGCGTVGSQIARLLVANKADLTSRAGAQIELAKVAVRDAKVKRDGVPDNLITTDANSIVNDPSIDLIIEVMGGISPAKELILTALKNGKSVVTANKALLAKDGAELYEAASKANVDLYYEAAVAGAIPILRPLRESLVGDQVIRIMGIVNGTTNYILTKMDEYGTAFSEALKQAQAAKAKLADARVNQDLNSEIDAQREIARLGYEEARLLESKSTLEAAALENKKAEIPNINLNRSIEPEVKADPKAEAWGAKNKWFGSDSAMTYTAFDIHKKLVDEEGFDPQTDEYYAEIDKRIRLEFPHKFANNATTETTKPTQVVASAKRSVKPGRKTVRLTPSQVAIAKKLGVPLEEYAKQLNITKEVS